jgi:hypothetical protein
MGGSLLVFSLICWGPVQELSPEQWPPLIFIQQLIGWSGPFPGLLEELYQSNENTLACVFLKFFNVLFIHFN